MDGSTSMEVSKAWRYFIRRGVKVSVSIVFQPLLSSQPNYNQQMVKFVKFKTTNFFNPTNPQIELFDGDLDELTRRFPSGLYTTFITLEGKQKVVGLSQHLARLNQVGESNGVEWTRKCLRVALQILPIETPDAKVRLLRPDGGGELVIMAENWVEIPSDLYETGVVVNLSYVARPSPNEKSSAFIQQSQTERDRNRSSGIYESLMVHNGRIREGFTSNVWFVRDGTLITASKNVLKGITREVILKCASELGIRVEGRSLRVVELPSIEEVFISSSSRGVLPVRQIEKHVFVVKTMDGISLRISAAYKKKIMEIAEPI